MVLRFIMLAGTFFVASCVAIERNNPDDPGSGNYFAEGKFESSSSVAVPSSSSVVLSSSSIAPSSSSKAVSSSSVAVPSSSSVAPSSSSKAVSSSSVATPSSSSTLPFSSSAQAEVIHGTPVIYGGETYETVVIGTQTWMARNLNYNANGSKCGNDNGSLSNANTSICDTYGRLYTWATAMGLPSNCNSSTCSSQVGTKHKGICPTDWHIPSDDDWTALTNFVGGFSTAGTKLKATDGWDSNGNGTDDYGFSALPGGYGGSIENFDNVGRRGYWWIATEGNANNAYAYFRFMGDNNEIVNRDGTFKVNLFSVRCVKD